MKADSGDFLPNRVEPVGSFYPDAGGERAG